MNKFNNDRFRFHIVFTHRRVCLVNIHCLYGVSVLHLALKCYKAFYSRISLGSRVVNKYRSHKAKYFILCLAQAKAKHKSKQLASLLGSMKLKCFKQSDSFKSSVLDALSIYKCIGTNNS